MHKNKPTKSPKYAPIKLANVTKKAIWSSFGLGFKIFPCLF